MYSITVEKILFYIVRAGIFMLPFTVLLVADGLFFPYITGKNFIFRVIVEIIAAAWAGLLIINFKKYFPRWNPLSIAFSVFIGLIFLTALLGTDFFQSFWSNFERMEGVVTHLHLLLLFFILAGTMKTRKEWFTLFGVTLFSSILLAFYGLLEATGEVETFADSTRIISTLGNPLYVAAYLSFHIFLAAFLWTKTKSSILRWFLGGALFFELIIFFLTQARGAFVGMIAGISIALLLSLFFSSGKKQKIVLGVLVAVFILAPVLLSVFKHSDFVQGSDILLRYANISIKEGEARFLIWGMALESFKERPVLGWGVGNFDIPYAKYYDPRMYGQEAWFDRVHNMPLEWLISGGVVLFASYLSVLIAGLWALFRAVKREILKRVDAFIFIGMFVAYVVQLLFVFDTLATYLLSTIMFAFFYAASAVSFGWEEKTSLTEKNVSKAERNQLFAARLSVVKISGIVGVFALLVLLVVFVNVRPFLAARSLIEGFRIADDLKQAPEIKERFEKALSYANGTIGTNEIRGQLVINFLKGAASSEEIQTKEAEELYVFAVEEAEDEVNRFSKKYMKIRDRILLGQLYGFLGARGNSREAFEHAASQYESVIAFAPRYVYAYPVYANMLAQTGNFERAVDLIDRAERLLVDAERYDPQIFYSKPLFYTANRQYDEAYAALLTIAETHGYAGERRLNPNMMENIIRTTQVQGGEAIPFLEKIQLLDPSLVSPLLMLAQLHALGGSQSAAREYANRALAIDPSIEEQIGQFLKALDGASEEE